MASRAQLLFADITADPVAWIAKAVQDKFTESEIIDFKQYRNDKDSRALWAKALSGFANSGGGIVMWGVDARKTKQPNERRLDVITGPAPLSDPRGFAQYLKEQHRTITTEPVQDVEIKPYVLPDGSGFVICHVPDGKHKPYRDEIEKQYWQRIQDSFTYISHSLLKSMFYPVTSTTLKVVAFWQEHRTFALYAANNGNATAEDVQALVLYNASDFHRTDPSLTKHPTQGYHDLQLGKDHLMIHPRQREYLAAFEITLANWHQPVELTISLYYRHSLPATFKLSFPVHTGGHIFAEGIDIEEVGSLVGSM